MPAFQSPKPSCSAARSARSRSPAAANCRVPRHGQRWKSRIFSSDTAPTSSTISSKLRTWRRSPRGYYCRCGPARSRRAPPAPCAATRSPSTPGAAPRRARAAERPDAAADRPPGRIASARCSRREMMLTSTRPGCGMEGHLGLGSWSRRSCACSRVSEALPNRASGGEVGHLAEAGERLLVAEAQRRHGAHG